MPTLRRIPLGDNNVYLVDDGGARILVDTGPDYRGAWEALQVATHQRAPDLVAATHGHLDHAGLGASWQEAAVPVGLGAGDCALAGGSAALDDITAARSVLAIAGLPSGLFESAAALLDRRRDQAVRARDTWGPPDPRRRWPTALRYRPFEPAVAFTGDERLPGELRVIACPGHTPGNAVLIHEAEGWLFSGDQLLPGYTPTPAIQAVPGSSGRERFRSLPAYVASLERLVARQWSRCLPGHGDPFTDVDGALRAVIAAIEQRTDRVARALSAQGPSTLFELAARLYPNAIGRRFWQVVPSVLGHLDLLEARGDARPGDEGRWERCA
jgi:glyoxylase-like metal-dependent hydrolase (beta-lactamase superfamily II)